MSEINFQKSKHARTVAKIKDLPQDGRPHIVLAGKSNVGKSSIVNRLCQQHHLARTSSTPGKTRQLIFYNVDDAFFLVDVPGYGYAASSHRETEAFSELCQKYFLNSEEIVLLVLLLDIRHLESKLDSMMRDWLLSLELPFVIVLNKCDKLSRARCLDQKRALQKTLSEAGLEGEILLTSALKGTGIEELRAIMLSVLDEEAESVQE